MPSEKIKIINTKFGAFKIFDRNDLITKSLKEYGEWAQNEINFCSNFIKFGDTVLDIGGYIGTAARAYSALVGPKGRVYSFEANPESYSILTQNSANSTFANIVPTNAALSSTSGQL